MEGRWNVVTFQDESDPRSPDITIPVVPCDDAAIERAAAFAAPFLRAEFTEAGAKAIVKGILRAAGETP